MPSTVGEILALAWNIMDTAAYNNRMRQEAKDPDTLFGAAVGWMDQMSFSHFCTLSQSVNKCCMVLLRYTVFANLHTTQRKLEIFKITLQMSQLACQRSDKTELDGFSLLLSELIQSIANQAMRQTISACQKDIRIFVTLSSLSQLHPLCDLTLYTCKRVSSIGILLPIKVGDGAYCTCTFAASMF